jgi:DNA-binding transcriptional LysR family regulator
MNKDFPAGADALIEARSWQQFLVLAETLHFGRAAERLHMTQPPLTLAIQKLERRLGMSLFDRSRRAVALTSAGASLVEPVREWLREGAALPALALGAAAGERGRVRVGFVSTIGFGPLPLWLHELRRTHPDLQVELREATGDVQMQAFALGELDAGFVIHAAGMPPPLRSPLQRMALGVEPMVLAVPEALARAPAQQWLAQPLVIFPRSIEPSLFDAVLAFYHRQGVSPRIAQEAIQMQTIVNLVSAGLGVALVPRSVTLLQRPGVVYRLLGRGAAQAAPNCETSLVWRADAGPVARRFVEFVRSTLG